MNKNYYNDNNMICGAAIRQTTSNNNYSNNANALHRNSNGTTINAIHAQTSSVHNGNAISSMPLLSASKPIPSYISVHGFCSCFVLYAKRFSVQQYKKNTNNIYF